MTTPRSKPSQFELDRRRLPRLAMALDVAFRPLAGAVQAPEVATVTVDLSLGGLCLMSSALHPVGTSLALRLTIPERAKPLELTGTLVWFQKADRHSAAGGYRFGIEFTALSPADREVLTALLNHPPAAQAAKAKRILLVEDDKELRLALKLRFESSGFEVLVAGDGLEALQKGREERPHIIILDLMLPNLNGFEVCRLLKYDQKYRHIPIILCSARCRSQDVEQGRQAGADAYITKPFDGRELITTVEGLLKEASP